MYKDRDQRKQISLGIPLGYGADRFDNTFLDHIHKFVHDSSGRKTISETGQANIPLQTVHFVMLLLVDTV